ncbi:hypothetical protein L2E82_24658 [Cichorium intybus]|uniref:Uncharacterized protein n=1 Tax=Cichorium intybus TaxID=13427 RepID=A0ACB9E1V9_CICIN|nr:hypothetical protein L2E82_24658 [Cichorium intybus]
MNQIAHSGLFQKFVKNMAGNHQIIETIPATTTIHNFSASISPIPPHPHVPKRRQIPCKLFRRRQIPYRMVKFGSFETNVETGYKYAIPTPKEECSKSFQLGVSFAGGYAAGILSAVVSHQADNLVSFLSNAQGATVGYAVKKLGMWGLFTCGLPLCIFMIGTLTGAQWGIYDSFKVFVGLPTTGAAPPTAAVE